MNAIEAQTQQTETIQLRLSKSLKTLLQSRADRLGHPLSVYIRLHLEEHVVNKVAEVGDVPSFDFAEMINRLDAIENAVAKISDIQRTVDRLDARYPIPLDLDDHH